MKKTNLYVLSSLAFLVACQSQPQSQSPVAPDFVSAARVGVPIDAASLKPWVLRDSTVIKYWLNIPDGFKPNAKEVFRQWSAVLQGLKLLKQTTEIHVRFVQAGNINEAQILVSGFTSNSGAGCVTGPVSRIRYCDINLRYGSDLSYWVGRVMGLPQSTNSADVLAGPSKGYLFTANDLATINATYNLFDGAVTTMPLFEANYANASGTEIVVGWDNLRARQRPGPTYVSSFTTMATVLGPGVISEYWAKTNPIFTYRTGGFGTYYYPEWPSIAGATVLGQGACPEPAALLLSTSADGSPKLFAGVRNSRPNPLDVGRPYGDGFIVPLYFFKDPTTKRYRVQIRLAGAPDLCGLLGGYGFAVE